MIINVTKIKAICFTKDRMTEPLSYSLRDTAIEKASSCKYLGIVLRTGLSWAGQVNYTVKTFLKALHFTMSILQKEKSNNKSLANTSLVQPILEYGAVCCGTYRERQISALDRVQNNAAKFAHHRNLSKRETLAQRRHISRICAHLQAYTGERAL
jgi:hypothetical protein